MWSYHTLTSYWCHQLSGDLLMPSVVWRSTYSFRGVGCGITTHWHLTDAISCLEIYILLQRRRMWNYHTLTSYWCHQLSGDLHTPSEEEDVELPHTDILLMPSVVWRSTYSFRGGGCGITTHWHLSDAISCLEIYILLQRSRMLNYHTLTSYWCHQLSGDLHTPSEEEDVELPHTDILLMPSVVWRSTYSFRGVGCWITTHWHLTDAISCLEIYILLQRRRMWNYHTLTTYWCHQLSGDLHTPSEEEDVELPHTDILLMPSVVWRSTYSFRGGGCWITTHWHLTDAISCLEIYILLQRRRMWNYHTLTSYWCHQLSGDLHTPSEEEDVELPHTDILVIGPKPQDVQVVRQTLEYPILMTQSPYQKQSCRYVSLVYAHCNKNVLK